MSSGSTLRYEKKAWMASSSPIAPPRTSYGAGHIGEPVHERFHQRHTGGSQASTICCASADVIANGFSHRTCLPAAAACSVQTP